MPALPSSLIEPLWCQFEALIPPVEDTCHQPRVADRVVFDKLVARLVLGGAYTKHADEKVSATTLRTRDRGKSGQKRSVLVEGHGLPIGTVLAGANRHDSPLLEPTLQCCDWQISPKGTFIEINHTRRWMIERTNSWHTRGFGILQVILDRSAPARTSRPGPA